MLSPEEVWLVLTIHVLGAILWVGGTISLAVVIWGVRRSFPNDPETVQRLAAQIGRAFAWVMWPALAVTVLTGLANLSWYAPPSQNWTGTPGAEWVDIATALVALMAVAAGLHTFAIGPWIRRLRERRVPPGVCRPLRVFNHLLEGVTLIASVLVVGVMVLLASI